MIPESEKFLGATVSKKNAVQILLALSFLQIVLSLSAWKSGMVADNDFVAHVAWLMEWTRLVDQWGLGFYWTQKFNFGQPLLLFNLPPLSTFTAWLLTKLGLTPVASLKFILSFSLCLMPWVMYWWHRMMMPKTRIVGLIAAAFSVLLTNEFWGLGFHFCNGMVNAAIALPMVVAFFAAIEKLMAKPDHPARWLGLAGIFYGLICLTHLHSAFLAALFAVTVEIGRYIRHKNHGRLIRDLLSCCISVLIGVGLSAFWLLPSLAHDAGIDWLHIWSPPTIETLRAMVNGQLLSGLRSTGLNVVSVDSAVSAYLVMALALIGIVAKLRRRRDYGLIAAFGLALWLTLSPGIAGPLKFLPFFERILHLRVASFLSIFLISLAARGAYACRKYRVGPLIFATLIVGVGLSAVTMSMSIRTESDFAGKRRDLNQVADWLNANAPGARIYSEFAGHSQEEVSANYLRHMLPILADVQDGASFVYENSFSAKDFLRRGIYWGSIIPLIDLAPEYHIQFLIAWTATAKRILSDDLRWNRKFLSGDYEVYERASTVDEVSPKSRQHLRLKQLGPNLFETEIFSSTDQRLIATSVPYSPGWSVSGYESEIGLTQDDRGLLNFDFTRLAQVPTTIRLKWSANPALVTAGKWLSVMMVLVSFILLLPYRSGMLDVEDAVMKPAEKRLAKVRHWHIKILGSLVLASCIGLQWQTFANREIARPFEGYGKSLEATYVEKIGTWRDFASGYAFQLVGSRWQGRRAEERRLGRNLSPRSSSRQILADLRVWIGDIDEVQLQLGFESESGAPVMIAIGGPEEWKYFELLSDQDLKLPVQALQTFLRTDSSRPGKFFEIAVLNSSDVRFNRISVRSGLHYLQAESFSQMSGDWTNQGSVGQWSNIDLQQGLGMISQMSWPMTRHNLGFVTPSDLISGCHEVWYLGIPAHGGQEVVMSTSREVLKNNDVSARSYGWIRLGSVRLNPEDVAELQIKALNIRPFSFEKRSVVTDALALLKTAEDLCPMK
jgi:hypothetical protein